MRMQSRSVGAGAIAIAAGLSLSTLACVDARGAYDDYGGRVIDAAPAADAPIVSALPDVDGDWLFTARPNLPEDRFLFFRVTLDLTPVTENTGTLVYDAIALNWQTMAPVGDRWTPAPADVGGDASFQVGFVGTLAPEANSISGTQVAVDGGLGGTLVTADFICGTATGDAGGFGLEGTTWAMVRITGETLPDPVWRCEDRPGE